MSNETKNNKTQPNKMKMWEKKSFFWYSSLVYKHQNLMSAFISLAHISLVFGKCQASIDVLLLISGELKMTKMKLLQQVRLWDVVAVVVIVVHSAWTRGKIIENENDKEI